MNSYFKGLKTLVLMQLKDKLDFSFLKSRKTVLFKSVYKVLLFALITFAIKILFDYIVGLGLFSFVKELNFRAFLVLMTVLFTLSFISCLFKVTNTLYFAKDNAFLVTMPTNSHTLFVSKLAVCLIYEFIKNVNYILPFLIAYGLNMGLPILYYIWTIFTVALFTLSSIALSGCLSIPLMYVIIFVKKSRTLEVFALMAVMSLLTIGLVETIAIIPENINLIRDWGKIYWSIQDFLKAFAEKTFIFDVFLQMITGMQYGVTSFNPFRITPLLTLCAVILLVGISGVIIFFVSKPLFLKMMSSPFEYKKNELIIPRKNRKRGVFISAVWQNTIQTFRSPAILYTVLAVGLMTPVSIFLQNKIIAAMDTAIFGNHLAVVFNVLIVLLMTLSSNVNMASVFSREGASAYVDKVNPAPYSAVLSSKLMLGGVVNVLSIIASVVIINAFANLGTASTIMLSIGICGVYVAHLFWSAEMDIMNPQNLQYQTTGSEQKNPNETKSIIAGFIASVVFALITFFLMLENINVAFIKTALVALLFLALRVYLFFIRVKLYYKEK